MNAMHAERKNLCDLPSEIIIKIIRYLDGPSIIKFFNLSKETKIVYAEIMVSYKIWRDICYSEIDLSFIKELTQDIHLNNINDNYIHNTYWKNLYQSWHIQRKLESMTSKTLKPIVKFSDTDSLKSNQIDSIIKMLIKDSYIITGHESGCIYQWPIDAEAYNYKTFNYHNKGFLLAKHNSGLIRDIVLINPFSSIYPNSSLLISIAQNNLIKICTTLPSYISDPDSSSECNIFSYNITHPNANGIYNLAQNSHSTQSNMVMTTICPIHHDVLSKNNLHYFCVGFRNGFLSLWEYETNLFDQNWEDFNRIKALNEIKFCARLRSVLKAHDSEIIHLGCWNETLATASIKLELKFWSINLPPYDLNDCKGGLGIVKHIPRFQCFHSLILGFHSYEQSLAFNGSYYTCPWNFVFKAGTFLAANLSILVCVTICSKPDSIKLDLVRSSTASNSSLTSDPCMSIAYKQFRAASKLPVYIKDDNTITAFSIRGNLLAIATFFGWVLVYYLKNIENGDDLKELNIQNTKPSFSHKFDFYVEYPNIPLSIFQMHGPIYITSLDINFWSSNRITLAAATQIGVMVVEFDT